MYFLALATDYDGTLAEDGVVTSQTKDALQRLKKTGRRLILVTGRVVPAIKEILPELTVFDRVVAENGAVIFDPSTGLERIIAPALPSHFVELLREMKVEPLSVGRVIAATWEPHQATVLDVIRMLGLDLQITFNKGAVMILPPGVNKGTGLLAALRDLDISSNNVVAVGDAENDHAFLQACGCSAAVANALPSVIAEADIKLREGYGAGVVELIDRMIGEDAIIAPKTRHGIRIGTDSAGNEVSIEPYRGRVLITGPSGSGKSTLATVLTERLAERRTEFCVIDPEGDYLDLHGAVCVGNAASAPKVSEALALCHDGHVNLVINIQALGLPERRSVVADFLSRISRFRLLTGRPHWLLIDEAHEVLPDSAKDVLDLLRRPISQAIFVTMFPKSLAVDILQAIDVVIAFGATPSKAFEVVAANRGVQTPKDLPTPGHDEALFWVPLSEDAPFLVQIDRPTQVHKRHIGKYSTGDVGAWHSFYFRGIGNHYNLRAGNLNEFFEIAFKVDDDTWTHHLLAGNYTSWFRDVFKDEDLACETAAIAANRSLGALESRKKIRKAVWQRYTVPCLSGEEVEQCWRQ